MKLSIVPVDGVVCKDGECLHHIDLSWIPENVHAVQWKDTHGHIEFTSTIPNEEINDLGIYAKASELWEERKLKEIQDAELLEQSIDYENMFIGSRNYRLLETDWTQLPNAPLTEEEKTNWEVYRQKLRDLTTVVTDINDMKAMCLDHYHPLWPVLPYPSKYKV